jgi:hypothetical protein
MSDFIQTKLAVTVAEMARMVGLSRARFYQLVEVGVFPAPERHAETKRPFYGEELQRTCLEVRRRNCGVNGKPVLFYARRVTVSARPTASRKSTPTSSRKAEPHAALLDAVKSLGLTAVTPAQVAAAVAELFPAGVGGVGEGEVIRSLFLWLKRQDSADNVGR